MSQSTSLLYRHRQLAPSASVRVSPLCLGTMNFDDALKDHLGECNKETTFEILDHFYNQGSNFIDTANEYQNGESEVWFTSGYRTHEQDKIQSNFGGNGLKSCEIQSIIPLKNVKQIILTYFICIGGIILSVFPSSCMVVIKANQYARDHDLRQLVVYQGLWNAAIRDFEREIIPMSLWGVLGQGYFQTEEAFKEGKPFSDLDKAVSKILEKVANAHNTNITSTKSLYVFPIVGGRKLEHIKGNIEALSIFLTNEEIAEIETAYIYDQGFPHTFLSGSLVFGTELRVSATTPGDIWLTKSLGTFQWVESAKPIERA
ncbi:voltage-gated shaker-like K+ channel, subunit [Umbelopsis sp. PMI_123]|nr:voltage-gated shaker-like K+ channel, subunit [Umbelopsis sp. PMI_123]